MKLGIQAMAFSAALIAACSAGAQAATDPLAPTGRWSAMTAGEAATPPMGWNSWNAFHTDLTEDK
ncbi:MAG: NPCBM/NEW2 domain-containing protein, partial [Asticcacaulis sp.]